MPTEPRASMPPRCRCRWACWGAGVALAALAIWAALRFTSDVPVTYASNEDHFKYGSTGGERSSGIPYSIWMALPELFPQSLPGRGERLGMAGRQPESAALEDLHRHDLRSGENATPPFPLPRHRRPGDEEYRQPRLPRRDRAAKF